MPLLGVNIDHVATVRQARRGLLPDPVEAALIAERSGCDSIVCHLREDRRHMQEDDLARLTAGVRTRLNLEMSVAPEIVALALRCRPQQATLVPERREELTTEGGLDLRRHGARVGEVVRALTAAGIEVSVFIDPTAESVELAQGLGVGLVELHTGRFAGAAAPAATEAGLEELRAAAERAHACQLRVNAGHGLDYANVARVARLPYLEELNIGFAIIARALLVGMDVAVRDMALLVHTTMGAQNSSRLRS